MTWWMLFGYQGHVCFTNLRVFPCALTYAWIANLQIPYLLNFAVLTIEFLPLFGTSTRSAQAAFRLIAKLDYAFSSLLVGHDSATGETLPGFDFGRNVSTTDKVRLKGIVDRTRLAVVRFMSGPHVATDEVDEGPMDTDTENERTKDTGMVTFEGFENNESDEGDGDDDDDDDAWEERNVANIYEKTIGELGDVLGGPPIGIITDDWALDTPAQQQSSGFTEHSIEHDLEL